MKSEVPVRRTGIHFGTACPVWPDLVPFRHLVGQAPQDRVFETLCSAAAGSGSGMSKVNP